MSAATLPLKIEKGAKFTKRLTWQDANGTPIDLTGYSARMHIRQSIEASAFELELTTSNGRITLGDTAGTVDLYLTAQETDTLTIKTGVYDLELYTDADNVVRLVEGSVSISEGVTR